MMFSKLSFSQKRIVACNEPRIIVKACPGSGKTYSVTARLARLLNCKKLSKHQGVAVLSFTNTACEEIKKGLSENFRVNEIGYPNFVGTIDNFINNYIFLPYGHLEMNCNVRPEIVGTEYNKWFEFDSSKRNFDHTKIIDPDYFFDKVSFNKDDKLLRLSSYQTYNLVKEDWENPLKINGELKKGISDLINMKYHHFRLGKAIQSDANYFANKILLRFPLVAQNLARKFPIIIIDEAQDTTELQMSIIDTLEKNGLESLMFIGDPDQAIFEWNTANAELFNEKWNSEKWYKLKLNENRRSSTKICNAINHFFNDNMISISEHKDYPESHQIQGYDSNDSLLDIYCNFIDKCNELSISDKDLFIVYRGKSFGEKFFGFINENGFNEEAPWENKCYFVRDIIHGKYLIEKGNFKIGLKLVERGYYKWKTGLPYISSNYLRDEINKLGYKYYRAQLFSFLNELPEVHDNTLVSWKNELKEKTGYDFKIKLSKSNIPISSLFHSENNFDVPFYINTIHSVKGKSIDAILVILVKKDRSNYVNLIGKNFNSLSSENKEQMRIVYVACSRPRKILWIAVPKEDVETWLSFLPSSN